MTAEVVCIDCKAAGATRPRKVHQRRGHDVPGKRCREHYFEQKRARSKATHGKRVEAVYGITEAQYWAIYEAQGGRCFICRWGQGKSKRLVVDHNHKTGEVRGLLCNNCNRNVIGRLGEDIAALRRAIWYLISPPARRILRPLPQSFDEVDSAA